MPNQRQPIRHGGEKMAERELRNLRIGIASLPAKYRQPLVLQSIGYGIEDICELLELTAVIVAARLAHGRKQLQLRLYPDDEVLILPQQLHRSSKSIAADAHAPGGT